jgi:hypothetical protein
MNLKQIRSSHFRNTYGTKNAGLAEAILYYGCIIKPEIISIREHSIIFADNSEEYIDEIVFCTGFENSFVFLDSAEEDPILKQVGHEARISHNLYKHAIHPLIGDSLIFIGFVRPCFGAVPPVFAMAGVPSRNKMYRTSAFSHVHAAVHFAQKTRVYTVHFAKDMYTLLSDL